MIETNQSTQIREEVKALFGAAPVLSDDPDDRLTASNLPEWKVPGQAGGPPLSIRAMTSQNAIAIAHTLARLRRCRITHEKTGRIIYT